jgi:hypothetical protein
MQDELTTLFSKLWQSYRRVTPSAERIHQLLGERESQPIVNDHIALRTFNLDPVRLDKLAGHFLKLGYQPGGEYHFEAKKLYARHYEHPDPDVPKVFISELLVDHCSAQLQAIVSDLVAQTSPDAVSADDFLISGSWITAPTRPFWRKANTPPGQPPGVIEPTILRSVSIILRASKRLHRSTNCLKNTASL